MKSDGPWLSVLMPAYNGAETLAESLGSVAKQSDGIEVIVVDQASSDGSAQIAKQFEDRMNIRVIKNPKSSGWIENTNLAMSHSRAPLSTFLHQDDFWRPGRADLLARLKEKFPNTELWAHGADFVDIESRVIGRFSPAFGQNERMVKTQEALHRMLVQDTLALPAVMFRTDTLRKLGGLDSSLQMTADWDLWLKLIREGGLAWSPDRKVAFRLHGAAQTMKITSDFEVYQEQLNIPIARHIDAMDVAQRPSTEAQAQASRQLNLWLASLYHGHGVSMRVFLKHFFAMGPHRWVPFFQNTQILHRVIPRIIMIIRNRRRRG